MRSLAGASGINMPCEWVLHRVEASGLLFHGVGWHSQSLGPPSSSFLSNLKGAANQAFPQPSYHHHQEQLCKICVCAPMCIHMCTCADTPVETRE